MTALDDYLQTRTADELNHLADALADLEARNGPLATLAWTLRRDIEDVRVRPPGRPARRVGGEHGAVARKARPTLCRCRSLHGSKVKGSGS